MDILKEPLFVAALPVVQRLCNAGYEAYFVGGSVRDSVLHKSISDVDIASSATPQEVKALFKHTVDVGIEHGTVMVLHEGEGYEITTFRTEAGYQDFRHPDSVTFVRSLEEDLKRRDFTINALALRTDGTIVDYFDGLGDLERQRITCVGDPMERFSEDALRMFRAVRFVGQLGFDIEAHTKAAIETLRMNLTKVAVERMKVEFEKLIQSPFRKRGLALFIETKLYEACPFFEGKEEALLQVANASLERLTVEQAWILLAHAAQLDEVDIKALLKAWKSSNELIKTVVIGYQTLQKRLRQPWDNFMAYACPESLAIEVEMLLSSLGYNSEIAACKQQYENLPIISMKSIELNGNDIQRILALDGKGAIIGVVLRTLEQEILQGTLQNDSVTLEKYIREHSEKFVNTH